MSHLQCLHLGAGAIRDMHPQTVGAKRGYHQSMSDSSIKAAILSEIYQNNAVRKEVGLPLLGVGKEFKKAYDVARLREWRASVASKHDDVERIKAEVLAEYFARFGPQFPVTSFSSIAVTRDTNKRFRAFAEVHYGFKIPTFGRRRD
jgi:hypothetical protein